MEAEQAAKRRLDQERAAREAEVRRVQKEREQKQKMDADRKNAEVQKELELMKARREAYEERLALQAKVKARKA